MSSVNKVTASFQITCQPRGSNLGEVSHESYDQQKSLYSRSNTHTKKNNLRFHFIGPVTSKAEGEGSISGTN